jgi:hypothetical protein
VHDTEKFRLIFHLFPIARFCFSNSYFEQFVCVVADIIGFLCLNMAYWQMLIVIFKNVFGDKLNSIGVRFAVNELDSLQKVAMDVPRMYKS